MASSSISSSGEVSRATSTMAHASRHPFSDRFHVIKGEAELETPDGQRIELTAGGIYSFPDGFTATWKARSPFMKFFVIA